MIPLFSTTDTTTSNKQLKPVCNEEGVAFVISTVSTEYMIWQYQNCHYAEKHTAIQSNNNEN